MSFIFFWCCPLGCRLGCAWVSIVRALPLIFEDAKNFKSLFWARACQLFFKKNWILCCKNESRIRNWTSFFHQTPPNHWSDIFAQKDAKPDIFFGVEKVVLVTVVCCRHSSLCTVLYAVFNPWKFLATKWNWKKHRSGYQFFFSIFSVITDFFFVVETDFQFPPDTKTQKNQQII